MENKHECCTPEGQIKRYVDCVGCDRKPIEKEVAMSKQTAVHWLMEQVANEENQKTLSGDQWRDIIDRAVQMEKEQLIKAVYDSMGTSFDPNMGRAELYYDETYGGNNE